MPTSEQEDERQGQTTKWSVYPNAPLPIYILYVQTLSR